MSFPRYPHYKPSGVEWLGEIPEHWEICRLGTICSKIGSGKTPSGGAENYETSGILFIRSQNVHDHGLMLDDAAYISDTIDSELSSSRVKRNDILLNITGASIGRTCIVSTEIGNANVNQHVCIIRMKNTENAFFVSLSLKSSNSQEQIAAMQTGAARDGLNYSQISRILTAFPPHDEQKNIITFLVQETAKIDALVAEQQRLIELLKEKRQAVISHAVTKGLDPTVPMKPSGIEWLGDIPAHWEIKRGRFLFRKLDIPPEPEDGVVTAFRDGQVTLRENRRTDGFTLAFLEVGYQRIRVGDLVIHGMDAFAGAIGVSESNGKCTPEYSVMTPAVPGVDNHYFAMILRLMAQRNYIFVICPSVRERAPRFRFESFKDVQLPVPPLNEQQAIMRLIRSTEAEVNNLTAEAERAIELLQERRTALISAAVTGQIDVRQLAQGVAA